MRAVLASASALALAAGLAACGPKPPAGVVFWISIDVERTATQVVLDGDLVDPGGTRGHAVSRATPFDDWKQATGGAPFVVTASDGGTLLGSLAVSPGQCLALCAQMGSCTADDIKFEWQSVEVDPTGAVVAGCTRCENGNGQVKATTCSMLGPPAPPSGP